MTMGIVAVACLSRDGGRRPGVMMTSTLSWTSSAARSARRRIALRPPELDDEVLALDVAVALESLPEGFDRATREAAVENAEEARSDTPSPPAAPRRRAARRGHQPARSAGSGGGPCRGWWGRHGYESTRIRRVLGDVGGRGAGPRQVRSARRQRLRRRAIIAGPTHGEARWSATRRGSEMS